MALPANFIVWAVSPEGRFLNGKFAGSMWDVATVKEMAAEIGGQVSLQLAVGGGHRARCHCRQMGDSYLQVIAEVLCTKSLRMKCGTMVATPGKCEYKQTTRKQKAVERIARPQTSGLC